MTEPGGAAPSDNTTLTDVLAAYTADGFDAEFELVEESGDLLCGTCRSVLVAEQVPLHSIRRLEGAVGSRRHVGGLCGHVPELRREGCRRHEVRAGGEHRGGRVPPSSREDRRDDAVAPPDSAPGEENTPGGLSPGTKSERRRSDPGVRLASVRLAEWGDASRPERLRLARDPGRPAVCAGCPAHGEWVRRAARSEPRRPRRPPTRRRRAVRLLHRPRHDAADQPRAASREGSGIEIIARAPAPPKNSRRLVDELRQQIMEALTEQLRVDLGAEQTEVHASVVPGS